MRKVMHGRTFSHISTDTRRTNSSAKTTSLAWFPISVTVLQTSSCNFSRVLTFEYWARNLRSEAKRIWKDSRALSNVSCRTQICALHYISVSMIIFMIVVLELLKTVRSATAFVKKKVERSAIILTTIKLILNTYVPQFQHKSAD